MSSFAFEADMLTRSESDMLEFWVEKGYCTMQGGTSNVYVISLSPSGGSVTKESRWDWHRQDQAFGESGFLSRNT